MSDELIAQGYSQSKAFEAVNSALKERLATSASQNLGIVFEAKIIMKNDVAYVEFSAPSMEKMGMDKQDFPIKNLKTSVKEALKEGLSLYLENQVLSEKNRPKFSQIDAAGLKLKLENSRNFSKDLQKALDLKLEKLKMVLHLFIAFTPENLICAGQNMMPNTKKNLDCKLLKLKNQKNQWKWKCNTKLKALRPTFYPEKPG